MSYRNDVKKITLRQVITAIRKERFPQHVGGYFKYINKGSKMRLTKACAVGQALFDLQIDSMWPATTDPTFKRAIENIIYMNDQDQKSLKDIADTIEEDYKDILDMYVDALPMNRVLTY